MTLPFQKDEDPWVRCEDCGRKIHQKKVWNSQANKFEDAWDKDKPHLCNTCEKQRWREQYVSS